MKLLNLFSFSLAVLSLTDILVFQTVARPIREFFGLEHDNFGDTISRKTTGSKWRDFFGEALECFRCTSVWIALILVVLHWLPGYKHLEQILIGSWVATYINRKA